MLVSPSTPGGRGGTSHMGRSGTRVGKFELPEERNMGVAV